MRTVYNIARRPEDLFFSKTKAQGLNKLQIFDGRGPGGGFAIYWAIPKRFLLSSVEGEVLKFRIIKEGERYYLGADTAWGTTWLCEVNLKLASIVAKPSRLKISGSAEIVGKAFAEIASAFKQRGRFFSRAMYIHSLPKARLRHLRAGI